MRSVLVTEDIHPRGMEILMGETNIEVVRVKNIDPETLRIAVRDVDAIIVRSAIFSADILQEARKLKIVSRHGVGCDNIDVDHLSARGIPVAIASGSNALSVAEHTLSLMLATARDLVNQNNSVKKGCWADRNKFRAVDLRGAKIVILGFGRTGRKVAPICKSIGMKVVVADIALDFDLAAKMDCRGVTDFRPELGDADFLTLHVPLNDSTRHIVSTNELATMKHGGILINCARGGVVDNSALVKALESGHIRAAGVDVMPIEPPPTNDPLITHPNVLMTPHNAAGAMSAAIAMSEMSAQNVVDMFAGKLAGDCVFNHDDIR